MNENRKYLLGLIAGLIVLPLLILLEIRILQDTKQQVWDAYYQTSDIVAQKEIRFNEIANDALADSLNLRKDWTDLVDISNSENASLFLFKNDSLVFWSRNESDAQRYLRVLDSGLHFLNVKNGSYLSFFKQSGTHKAVLLYSIKTNYNYQNQYIENHFNDELSFLGSALLSPSKLKDFEDVTDSKGKYLFSIQIFGAGKVTPFWLKLLITILILFCVVFSPRHSILCRTKNGAFYYCIFCFNFICKMAFSSIQNTCFYL